MLKWVPSKEARKERERQEHEARSERERQKHVARTERERKKREARSERERKEQEAKRAREQHAEKILAEVIMKAECDRWDQHVRNLQHLKPHKSRCWFWK